MIRINWELFWENNSTAEVTYDFAEGRISFKEFSEYMDTYCAELKKEIAKMKSIKSVKNIRNRARRACSWGPYE